MIEGTRDRRGRGRSALVVTLPLLLVGSASAFAAEGGERPQTWDMTLEELQAIGLGQSRGDPVPVPADFTRRNAEPRPLEGAALDPWIIFVNFDGETLSAGQDSAQSNVTQVPMMAGPFAAYGEGPMRDAVLQAVAADWAAYNFDVVDERPESGEYVMNMTGPTNPFGGGVLGIAPVDCLNQQTHSNITFAFHSADDGFSAAITATTIGQEVAHSFGLEHVDQPMDIMNPYNAGGDPSFIDECIPVVGGAYCPDQHQMHCPGTLAQNAHQELLSMFGPAIVDTDGPSVLVTTPFDGMEYDEGTDFTVLATITDDSEVAEATLYDNGVPVEVDTSEPWGWPINGAAPGVHVFEVTAVDEHGNEGVSNMVAITVVAPGGGTAGGETDGETDGAGLGDGGDEGCGCRQQGPGGPAALGVLLLVALGLRRRG